MFLQKGIDMTEEKVLIKINGVEHYLSNVIKFVNVFLSIVATLPEEQDFKDVNLVNKALFAYAGIKTYGNRTINNFFEEKGIIGLSELGEFSKKTNKRTCNKYNINIVNLCNFLNSLRYFTNQSCVTKSLKILSKRDDLPGYISTFLRRFVTRPNDRMADFTDGEHYDIQLVNQSDELCALYTSGTPVYNRYNW